MPREGVRRDTVTFSTVITACGNGGRWREALAIFESMVVNWEAGYPPPNTITYCAAISACGKARGTL